MRNSLTVVCALLVTSTSSLSLSITITTPAHAQQSTAEAELTTARALFEEGLAREDAKDWAGALMRFKRVAEIRNTPQVQYNIALCLEHTDKLASADKVYERVIQSAEGSHEASVKELGKLSTARRAAIRSSIPTVTFTSMPKDAPRDVTLTLDGQALTSAGPLAIDAGLHELIASRASDKAEAKKSFTVEANGHPTIAIPIPAATKTDLSSASSSSSQQPSQEGRGGGIPTIAFVTGGVAIVAAGVGVFSTLSRGSSISDLDAACGPNRDTCPESKRSEADNVTTMTTVANVSFGVAILAAVTTVAIIYFVGGSSSSKKSALTSLGLLRF